MTDKATKQGNGVSPISGVAPPKETQFGQPNGNARHNGAWKKEDTPRFKLEQMMQLSKTKLQDIVDDDDAPYFESRLAQAIIDSNWKEIDSMINQVYGKPKESVDVTTQGESINPYTQLKADELRKLASN